MCDSLLCKGCDTPLSDCGSVGFACLNKSCSYELDLAIAWLKEMKERKEKAELSRLKTKYEGS